jgi:hypothetical protein
MMFLSETGSFQPFWRARSWASERLIYVHVSGDLRWAVISLVLGSMRAVCALGWQQCVLLAHRAASRATKHADTMVAAGRR